MAQALIHADLPSDRCSSVISVTRALVDQVRAAGVDVSERRVIERDGRVERSSVAWFHGYPHQLRGTPLQLGQHRLAGLQVDAAPALDEWRRFTRAIDCAYFPSAWCRDVLRPVLPTGCETMIVPHGVKKPPPPPGPLDRGDHPCAVMFSVPGAQQPPWQAAHHFRKGVDVAVAATKAAGWDLVLRAGSAAKQWLDEIGADHVVLLDRYLEPGEMSDMMRRAHAVLVPSRAEAYGMVAAEALAHGALVVATTGTGMDDYLPHDHRCVLVEPTARAGNGGQVLSTFGMAAGEVNRVDPEDVADALLEVMIDHDERREIAEAEADAWYEAHSWEAATAPLVRWIRDRV